MKSVNQVLEDLAPIFRKAFDDQGLVLTEDMSARNVEGWDSFTHTRLIVDIEAHYGIKFRLKEVLGFRTVGDMCGAIVRLTQ